MRAIKPNHIQKIVSGIKILAFFFRILRNHSLVRRKEKEEEEEEEEDQSNEEFLEEEEEERSMMAIIIIDNDCILRFIHRRERLIPLVRFEN